MSGPVARGPREPPPGRWVATAPAAMYLCFGLYVVALLCVGRFPAVDEVLFKAAGKEWALRGLFAAPDIVGRLNFDPPITRIYAAYQPIYTFLFGLWVRVFGFGWRQGCAYDACIHVALCWSAYRLSRALLPARGAWAACAVAIVLLPVGTDARPDELAMTFGVLALSLGGFGQGARRPWLSGVLWGLCLGTSLPVFGPFATIAAVAVVAGGELRRASLWIGLLRTSLLVLAVQIVVWGPIVVTEPRALGQFLQHASNASGSPSLFENFPWHWRFTRAAFLPTATAVLAGVLLAGVLVSQGEGRRAAAIIGGPTLASVLLAAGHNSFYLWFTFPVLLAGLAWALFQARERMRTRLAVPVLTLVLLGVAVAGQRRVTAMIALATLPADQAMDVNAELLRALIPAGSTVLTADHWYTLAATHRTLDLDVSTPEQLRQSEFVVLTANFTGGPGLRRQLAPDMEAELRAHFEVVSDHLPHDVPRLFGIPLARSSRGFGAIVFRRRTAAS